MRISYNVRMAYIICIAHNVRKLGFIRIALLRRFRRIIRITHNVQGAANMRISHKIRVMCNAPKMAKKV
jgi:hypothetical protein